MASSKPITLSLVIFLTCVAHQISSSKTYIPISNLQDPNIINLAVFAVREYVRKKHKFLIFIDLVKGYVGEVNGLNFKLLIIATDGESQEKYEAIVWTNDIHATKKRLTSFKKFATN